MSDAKNVSAALAGTIEEVAQSLTKKHSEMELLLVAAPKSIGLLAQITLLATSVTDTSLKPPKDGFKYIKYEGSFRACLHQLVNTGYTTFNNAQTKIQKISSQSSHIPGSIAKIIECLLEGEPEDIADAIPIILQEIEGIANTCVQLAASTEKEFDELLQFTQELAEAGANSGDIRSSAEQTLTADQVSSLLSEMSTLDISQTSISKVRSFLQEGLSVLASLRTQWQNLVQYFNAVASVIKITMQVSFSHYVTALQAAQKRLQTGRALTKVAKDTLHFHAIHISSVANHVHMISDSYCDVSRKHLNERLQDLGGLIALDRVKDLDKIKQLQGDIYQGCVASQTDIETMAEQNKAKVLGVYRGKLEKLCGSLTQDVTSEQQAQFLQILKA